MSEKLTVEDINLIQAAMDCLSMEYMESASEPPEYDAVCEKLAAMRKAAQDVGQEPVAWIVRHLRFCGKFTDDKEITECWENKEKGCTVPLYLHPHPAAQQPDATLVEALEAALMVMTSKEVRLEKQADAITMIRSQLAAHRKQGGDV